MTVTFLPLAEHDRKALEATVRAVYLDGMCYEFAIALHKRLEWPLVGLKVGSGTETIIRHALVSAPGEMRFFDARGFVPLLDVGEPFGIGGPFRLDIITPGELEKVRPVHQRDVTRAAYFAEMLWPEMPWKGSRSRVEAFLTELERLSRHYQLWIDGPYATTWPILREGNEDVAGYEARPLASGTGYTFSRKLT